MDILWAYLHLKNELPTQVLIQKAQHFHALCAVTTVATVLRKVVTIYICGPGEERAQRS